MIDNDLLSIMCCPSDKTALELRDGAAALVCTEGHVYPIREGIPVFDEYLGPERVDLDYQPITTKAVETRVNKLRGRWSLDAGCGRGVYRTFLPGRYVGLDLMFEFLTIAAKKHPDADLVAGNIASLPFRNDSFDVVLASQVIEHVAETDFDQAIEELKRVCRGVVVVDTPNEGRMMGWVRRRIYCDEEVGGVHPASSPLSHKTLVTAGSLKQRGFRVQGCIGYVTRNRFPSRVWELYDSVAARVPYLAGNLIGTFQRSN